MVERRDEFLPAKSRAAESLTWSLSFRNGCARVAVDSDTSKSFAIWTFMASPTSGVDRSKKEYVRGDVHTNTIEGFWGAPKRGISGTYVWVSAKHLQKYLWEFEYRHNLRSEPWLMFQLWLTAFPRASR
jgi:hypothetical protein